MKLASAKVGDIFDGALLVESFQTGTTAKGKLYANLKLRDKEGTSIKGVMWDLPEDATPHMTAGKVIHLIAARVGEYNGAKQLTLEAFQPSPLPATDFAKESQFDVSEMMRKIHRTIDSFEDDKIKQLAESLLESPLEDAFRRAPAATGVHNNWVGGLVEHVCSMIDIAEPIIKHYQKDYAPYLRRDHLLFGIIFHDLGKVIEYDVNNPAFERTIAGHYVNHIVMGPAWIYQKSRDLGLSHETVMHLMHLVASHHGCYEWGSPTKPVTLEAILLHHIDNMDSKFMHAWDMMENTAECSGGLTKKSWVEGTKFISQKEAFDAKQVRAAAQTAGTGRGNPTSPDTGPQEQNAPVPPQPVGDRGPNTTKAAEPDVTSF